MGLGARPLICAHECRCSALCSKDGLLGVVNFHYVTGSILEKDCLRKLGAWPYRPLIFLNLPLLTHFAYPSPQLLQRWKSPKFDLDFSIFDPSHSDALMFRDEAVYEYEKNPWLTLFDLCPAKIWYISAPSLLRTTVLPRTHPFSQTGWDNF